MNEGDELGSVVGVKLGLWVSVGTKLGTELSVSEGTNVGEKDSDVDGKSE